jgi:hypothetical protein
VTEAELIKKLSDILLITEQQVMNKTKIQVILELVQLIDNQENLLQMWVDEQ